MSDIWCTRRTFACHTSSPILGLIAYLCFSYIQSEVFKEQFVLYCCHPPFFDGAVCLAPVVQTMDSAIHPTNQYPLDNSISFATCIVYPLDSDLSGGWHYPSFEQLGPGLLHLAMTTKPLM